MKLWKKTTVMLISFAALTIVAVLVAVIPSTGGGPAFNLPAVAKDAITKIQFLNVASPYTLEKSGDAWTIMPGGFKVADKKMDSALETLSKLNIGTLVSSSEDQLAAYEVADDAPAVAVFNARGEVWRLIVGKDSADRRGNYVRIPGDKRVFMCVGRLKTAVPTDLKAWRERQITKFDKDKATRLAVEAGGLSLAFAKEEGKDWAFEKTPENLPPDFRLDSSKVDKAIVTLSNMNAADFKDGAADASMGLVPPAASAFVTLKEGEPVAVLYGKEEDKKIYLQKKGDSQIYLISSYQKDQVPATIEGYRDMKVAPFKAEEAVKVEIQKGKDKLVFDKADKWALIESTEDKPEGFLLDSVKVDNLVRSASRLEAKTLLGKAAPPASGLASPQGLLKVTMKDGSVKQIKVGAEVGEEKTKETYLQGDAGLVYLAAQGTGARLLKGLGEFKVTAAPAQAAPNMMSPDMLSKLPPGVREQLMQQQKQKIMQNQMLKQMMKKSGADEPKKP